MNREWHIDEQIRRALNNMAHKETVLASVVEHRDPCVRCGVRGEVHKELGCARYAT